MSFSGRVTQVTIKDDKNPGVVRRFCDAELTSISNGGNPRVTVVAPPDNEIVIEFYLQDCTYIDISSEAGSVECIRINPTKQTLVIVNKKKECNELLDYIRDYLTKDQSSKHKVQLDDQEDQKVSDEKVDGFITALNSSDEIKAAEYARDLARKKPSIRFLLDKIENSKDTTTDQQSSPIAEVFRLPVIIESILDSHDIPKSYDVVIRRDTTISKLKAIVQNEAGISSEFQHWYFNRQPLDDDYKFDAKSMYLNKEAKLILYIANH